MVRWALVFGSKNGCCNYLFCFLPTTMWREVPLSFPNRRGRKSAARAGFISHAHRVSEDKGSPCRLAMLGINKGDLDYFPDLLISVCEKLYLSVCGNVWIIPSRHLYERSSDGKNGRKQWDVGDAPVTGRKMGERNQHHKPLKGLATEN